MFVARCTPVGREAIARLRSRTVGDGRAVDGCSPAGVATGCGAGISLREPASHTGGQTGDTMGKAPRRYRPRKVAARSTYTWSADTVSTTAPSNIAPQVEPRHSVSHRPESARSAATTFVDVRALHAGLRALAELAAVRDEARRVIVGHDDQIRTAVVHLRVDGASWGQIGAALCISRQGARQRFDPAARAAHRPRPIHARSTDLADDVTPPAERRTPADDEQEGSRWTSWRP